VKAIWRRATATIFHQAVDLPLVPVILDRNSPRTHQVHTAASCVLSGSHTAVTSPALSKLTHRRRAGWRRRGFHLGSLDRLTGLIFYQIGLFCFFTGRLGDAALLLSPHSSDAVEGSPRATFSAR